VLYGRARTALGIIGVPANANGAKRGRAGGRGALVEIVSMIRARMTFSFVPCLTPSTHHDVIEVVIARNSAPTGNVHARPCTARGKIGRIIIKVRNSRASRRPPIPPRRPAAATRDIWPLKEGRARVLPSFIRSARISSRTDAPPNFTSCFLPSAAPSAICS